MCAEDAKTAANRLGFAYLSYDDGRVVVSVPDALSAFRLGTEMAKILAEKTKP